MCIECVSIRSSSDRQASMNSSTRSNPWRSMYRLIRVALLREDDYEYLQGANRFPSKGYMEDFINPPAVLEREGVASFAKSFEELLATMGERSLEFLAN